MDSIKKQLEAAGQPMSFHFSDIYTPVNEVTRKIINEYKFKSGVTVFKNNIDGQMWYDIPLADDDYFNLKLQNGDYYTDQLAKLKGSVKIQLIDDDGTKTNWLDLNTQSTLALCEFLKRRV